MNRMPRALAILAFTLLAGASLPAATAHAAIYVCSCVLSPKQETPPTASSGAGGGYFVIDTDANQVKYWISFGGLTSPENAAHIHGFAAPGIGGGILTSLPAGNPKIVATTPVADCISAAPRKNARLMADSALPAFCASTSCRVMP